MTAPEPSCSMPPAVTVVVPVYNGERFLDETIRSVLAQTYEDWELLVVDDGSTDGSVAIARQHADVSGGRVRCLEHPGHSNRGVSASRNLGLHHARGPYLALLDQDDVWAPGKLAEQVALMEAHPEAGMVCGAALYWHSWDPAAAARDEAVAVGGPQDSVVPAPRLLTTLYPLGAGEAPCPSGLLMRRDVLAAAGGFEVEFHGDLQLYEDQAFLAKLYLRTPVVVSSACWGRYRQHATSVMAGIVAAGRYGAVRHHFLEWFERYLIAEGQRGTPAWRALQGALWPHRHPFQTRALDLARRIARRVGRGRS